MKKQVVNSLNWAHDGYHHLKQPFEQIVLHIVHDDEHGQFSLLVFLVEQPVKNNKYQLSFCKLSQKLYVI
jgi:hypothetical protein